MKKTLILIIWLLTVSNLYAQRILIAKDQSYPKADTILCYLPQNVSAADSVKFPTVIMLHGYGGTYKQWSSITNLQNLSNEFKMILVCPDGFKDSWYIDSPLKKGENFGTFFRNKIFPIIKDSLPVDTSLVFITGLSMGGHGAIRLFYQNPELFCAAGSMSGVMDLKASSVTASLTKHLGKNTPQNSNWESFSAVGNISLIKSANKPLIINCGAQDYLVNANRKFAKMCAEQDIDVVYTESPGKHTRDYWRITLPEQLRFFRKFVNRRYNQD